MFRHSFKKVEILAIFAILGFAGCQSSSRDFKATVARFYLESTTGEGNKITLPRSGITAMVSTKPVLSEGDIVNVELIEVDLGKCLMFELTPAASRDYYRTSVSQNGRRVFLTINQVPLGARRIDGAISDGRLFVFVEVPDAELPALVADLKKSAVAIQKEHARR